MYLYNRKTEKKIALHVFHFDIDRGYGFSDTGNSLIIATSYAFTIWNRERV